MKRLLLVIAAITVAAVWASTASATDVPRYQTQSATLTASVRNGDYVHVYNITISPCDSSFTGTGTNTTQDVTETVGGTLDGAFLNMTFHSLYDPMGNINPGYTWTYSGPLSGGTGYGSDGHDFPVSFSLVLGSSSTWSSHAAYASATGGGNTASDSCIGNPLPGSQPPPPTPAQLCAMTVQDVQGSAKYIALKPVARKVVDLLVQGGCLYLTSMKPNLTASQNKALVHLYEQVVQALVPLGWVSQSQATTLVGLAETL